MCYGLLTLCYLSNLNSRQSLCISLSQVQLVLRHVELLHLIGSIYWHNVLKEDNRLLEKALYVFFYYFNMSKHNHVKSKNPTLATMLTVHPYTLYQHEHMSVVTPGQMTVHIRTCTSVLINRCNYCGTEMNRW